MEKAPQHIGNNSPSRYHAPMNATKMISIRNLALAACLLLFACSSWPEAGITEDLARTRKAQIGAVEYSLEIQLKPDESTFHGVAHIGFELKHVPRQLVLDFRGRSVGGIVGDGEVLNQEQWTWKNGHLVFDGKLFKVGKNELHIPFESSVGEAGDGLIRSVDVRDGSTYIYSLNVPADGHSVFPCFDQPNIKARFSSAITVPRRWLAISHTNEAGFQDDDKRNTRTWFFPPSAPISTYLYAFAAGPFMEYRGSGGGRPMRFFYRRGAAERAAAQAAEIIRLHGESLVFFEKYFGVRYPFQKFDFVAMPDFPFQGMEHPGCIFYGENSLLFRTEPTQLRQLRRADLIAHETAHMWFGDLVTMPWFDDVWLKEGFATFMAHKAVSAANPDADRDTDFFCRNYPSALASDATRGAQAMRRPLNNLNDAKSNYGPIIYRKGPAVLRQLEFALGEAAFQGGVRLFLERYPYSTGDWPALRRCFEDASGGVSLIEWSAAWIEGAGSPVVMGSKVAEAEGMTTIRLTQSPCSGDPERTWPLSTSTAIHGTDGSTHSAHAAFNTHETDVSFQETDGGFFFPNHNCRAYGLFLMNEADRLQAMEQFASLGDGLLRTQLWESLWNDVLRGNLSPESYLEFAVEHVHRESELRLLRLIFSHMIQSVDELMKGSESETWAGTIEAAMLKAATAMERPRDYRYVAWKAYMAGASSASGRDYLALRCEGKAVAPGELPMTRWERWNILTRLSALGDSRVPGLIRELESIRLGDADEVRRRRFLVDCAWPDAESKRKLFDRFFTDRSLPERWVQNGAAAFFQPRQSKLVAPYLQPAIEKLDWIKQNRKIFFLADWINAVVESGHDHQAASWVQSYVDRPSTQPDIAKKVLVALDHLLSRLNVVGNQRSD